MQKNNTENLTIRLTDLRLTPILEIEYRKYRNTVLFQSRGRNMKREKDRESEKAS